MSPVYTYIDVCVCLFMSIHSLLPSVFAIHLEAFSLSLFSKEENCRQRDGRDDEETKKNSEIHTFLASLSVSSSFFVSLLLFFYLSFWQLHAKWTPTWRILELDDFTPSLRSKLNAGVAPSILFLAFSPLVVFSPGFLQASRFVQSFIHSVSLSIYLSRCGYTERYVFLDIHTRRQGGETSRW